jgi:hypothetical protein
VPIAEITLGRSDAPPKRWNVVELGSGKVSAEAELDNLDLPPGAALPVDHLPPAPGAHAGAEADPAGAMAF